LVQVTEGLVALEVAGVPLAMVQLCVPELVLGTKVVAPLVVGVAGDVVNPASGVCTEMAVEKGDEAPQVLLLVTVRFPDTAPVMETVRLAVP
jgi:hypothetical protein